MTVTRDSNNYSVFSTSGTIYYVSNGGSDSNAGTSVGAPFATFKAAYDASRAAHGATSDDWILFEKGGTWLTSTLRAAANDSLVLNGISQQRPFVIGSYHASQPGVVNPAVAGARPQILDPGGFDNYLFQTASTNGNNLALVGLQYYFAARDPDNATYYSSSLDGASGLSSQLILACQSATSILIEDCDFSFGRVNIDFNTAGSGGGRDSFIINRCVIRNAFHTGTSQLCSGLILNDTYDGITIENSLFDHNGWNDTVATDSNMEFYHNIYLGSGGTGAGGPNTIRNCIIARDSGGVQFRGGGTQYNNLCVRNAINPNFGQPHAVTDNSVNSCVFTEAVDLPCIPPVSAPRGWGLGFFSDYVHAGGETDYGVGQCLVSNNIFSNWQTSSDEHFAVNFIQNIIHADVITGPYYCRNNTVTGNYFYNLPEAILSEVSDTTVKTAAQQLADNTVTGNYAGSVTRNSFSITYGSLPKTPTRTVATYAQQILGVVGGTYVDYLSLCRAQNRGNYNPLLDAASINDYFRQDYGLPMIGSAYATQYGGSQSPTTAPRGNSKHKKMYYYH